VQKGVAKHDTLAKDRNELPPLVLLTGAGFRASVQRGSTKNINFGIFFRGMHPRREALCGSVRRFPVPGGSFPVEQVKRLTRAYSV